MTTYICKCGRRVKKSADASTTGNRLSGYAPGHECWGCPYAIPYGDFQWDESARTVVRETRGYECRMSKTLTYASEFAGSIKDKCTCRVHSLDFDFLSQVSAWIKDTYPDREIFGSFSKDIRASTPQQEMEKILADIKKAKEILSCAPAQNADAALTTAENAVPTATAATPTTLENGADASASTPATSLQNCGSAPVVSVDGSSAPTPSAPSFDFGADDQTNALLLQDAQTFITGNMARIMAAKHAHDLTANHYQGSWGKWCTAVGISRDTGDNMVRVAEQFGNIQLEGKSILDVQPMKLLYAAAKPSTPEVVKQAVFTGDITTYKEYQELMAQLKAEKDRANAAEKSAQNARKKNAYFKELVKSAEAQTHKDAEKREEAESRYESALADISGLTEQNARLNAEKEQAEARAHKAEDALKKQPITGVVDKDEVKRQAEALSRNAVQEARQQAAEAQARLRQYQEDAEGLLAPAQACAQQAQFIADSVRAMYLNWFGSAVAADASLAQMGTPLYAVCGEIMSSLEEENTINPTAAGSEEDAEREALFE